MLTIVSILKSFVNDQVKETTVVPVCGFGSMRAGFEVVPVDPECAHWQTIISFSVILGRGI